MHQAHNIPWHLIESNFKFILDNKRYTPHKSALFLKDTPHGLSELKHLATKLIATIKDFSDTERRKYPAQLPPVTTGNIFSDTLLEKYPEYLTRGVQRIEGWIKRFQTRPWAHHGELINVVNVLLAENEMETLLMLAQHPQIDMRKLHYHSWGHHFGFCRAKEAALAAYMFFNAAEAAGVLANGQYACDSNYSSLVVVLTHSMDYSAQQAPHIAFFREVGALHKSARETFVHTDYERLQRYMKDLFALLYRYDVLAKECGIDPEWWGQIITCYPLRTKWDESAGDFVLG